MRKRERKEMGRIREKMRLEDLFRQKKTQVVDTEGKVSPPMTQHSASSMDN